MRPADILPRTTQAAVVPFGLATISSLSALTSVTPTFSRLAGSHTDGGGAKSVLPGPDEGHESLQEFPELCLYRSIGERAGGIKHALRARDHEAASEPRLGVECPQNR